MKVLFLSHLYPNTMNEVFGIFVHDQVRELVKQGCDIRVVSPIPLSPFPLRLFKRKWEDYSKVPLEEMRDGIKIYHPRYICFPKGFLLSFSGFLMYLGLRGLLDRIYYEGFKFDLIHSHVALPDGYAGMKVSKRFKVPLVVTVHGVDVCTAPAKPTIERSRRCREAELRVFNYAHQVVGVSTKVSKLIQSYSTGQARVITVQNGVPKSRIAQNAKGERKDGVEILLSVGNLVIRKGHEFVIRALPQLVEKHAKLKYVIIGDGENERYLRSLSSELGVSQYVEFLGRRGQDEVYSWMNKADVFVLPSWAEAFGVVYLEAMAAGTPVIACKGEGIEDVIADGKSGFLVEPKDVASLSQALDRLLSDRSFARRVGEEGRQRVKSFTWGANARKYVELYKELIDKSLAT